MGLIRRGSACLIAILLISAGVIAAPARAQTTPDDPAFEFQWALSQIQAPAAWDTGRGRGATVAVLDTGVHLEHEDLAGKLLNGTDFVNNDRVAQDDNGQGTHVAGIIGAVTANGRGIAGVAPQAQILPIKVLDEEDEATEQRLLAGIRHAIDRKAQVLVMDLDNDTQLSAEGRTFRSAIEDAFKAGVLPVVASEHPYVRSSAFAEAPVLVVAGVTRQGTASEFSNGVGAARWGLSAPGGTGGGDENDIFSTYWPHTRRDPIGGNQEFGRYAYFAHNVVAAAHVAGVAAILRGLGQSPRQTAERLLASAIDAGPRGPDQTYGAGLLNASQAVKGLPPDRREARATTTTTTAAPGASAGAAGGQGGGQPTGEVRPPTGTAVSPQPAQPGTAAGAEEAPAAEPGASQPEAPVSDDITGGLAAQELDQLPGKVPVLPIIAFLLLVGSATITWAMRRRVGDAPVDPSLNS